VKRKKVRYKEKDQRGGIVRDPQVQKEIEDILKLQKPRNLFSLGRMIYLTVKDYSMSMNFFVFLLIAIVAHYVLLRRKLLAKLVTFLLDRIA